MNRKNFHYFKKSHGFFDAVKIYEIESALAMKKDQVVPIPPNKYCAQPTARPCVILKARGWIAGAKFNLLCAHTIDSINSCQ